MLASINDGTDRADLRPETKLEMHAAACRAPKEFISSVGILESLEGFWRVLALGFESSHEHRTTSNLMAAENSYYYYYIIIIIITGRPYIEKPP